MALTRNIIATLNITEKKLVSKCIFAMSHASVIYFKCVFKCQGETLETQKILFPYIHSDPRV